MDDMNRLDHSEVREDHVHDRLVVIAPKRGSRPHDVPVVSEPEGDPSQDPFSQEETYSDLVHELRDPLDADQWWVRVIKNKFPAMTTDNPDAYGQQEVVIETSEFGVELGSLPLERIVAVLKVYGERVKALMQDPKLRYILVFKNKGGSAGASLRHAHSQIFASEIVPPHLLRKQDALERFHRENGRNYYEHLFETERGGPREIGADECALAFTPYASIYPYEAWILPKKQVDNISLLDECEIQSVARLLKQILGKLSEHGFAYNYYMHQTVGHEEEHFYLRVAPRTNTWAGVELGSHLIINPMPPEEAAEFYRS